MYVAIPPIPPPFGASSSNPGSPNANRVDTMPTTTDPINTTTTTDVAQSVVDENLPQLLDSKGGSHVTNVPAFNKEDFRSWKVRILVFLDGLEFYLMKTLEDGPFVPIKLAEQKEKRKAEEEIKAAKDEQKRKPDKEVAAKAKAEEEATISKAAKEKAKAAEEKSKKKTTKTRIKEAKGVEVTKISLTEDNEENAEKDVQENVDDATQSKEEFLAKLKAMKKTTEEEARKEAHEQAKKKED
nr:hypothetical protein [Tanacetum cinerariifolium]